MLPRLQPKEFYDLVIEVAIVRPGPIQGNMVHPYLRRRQKLEEPVYYNTALEDVLERTLGIPLFQEQAMQIAIVGAGFSPGKADSLRRAMAAWRRTGKIAQFGEEFIAGMLANGYPLEFAKNCFAQIQGFAEYGFPESHAASFALLVYASCWLKCHYPDVFACALLNSQPMGFYAPSQIIRDVREHGVEVREPDINLSDLECLLEADRDRRVSDHIWQQHRDMVGDIKSTHAVRLGLRFVEGLAENDINIIVARRSAGRYQSVRDLWLRTGVPVASLEKLARADAFASMGLNRREALWAVRGLVGTHGAETLPLFVNSGLPQSQRAEDAANLPLMSPGEEVIHDYATLSLSLKGHPVQFLRPMLDQRGTTRAANLTTVPPNVTIEVAGLVLVRQRPGTASGVVFVTLEDETGVANLVVWPKLFDGNDEMRKILLSSRMLAVRGKVQQEGLVIHVIAEDMVDLTPRLLDLSHGVDIGDAVVARADEGKSGPPEHSSRDRNAVREVEMARRRAYAALPGGRNFH